MTKRENDNIIKHFLKGLDYP